MKRILVLWNERNSVTWNQEPFSEEVSVVIFHTISRCLCWIPHQWTSPQHFLWDTNACSEKASYVWNLIDLATIMVVIRPLVPNILKYCNSRLFLFFPRIVFEKSSKTLLYMLKFNLRIFLRSYYWQNQFSPQVECCITNISSKFLIWQTWALFTKSIEHIYFQVALETKISMNKWF